MKTRLAELPYHSDSVAYASCVMQRPFPALLSSASSSLGRYDILTSDPATVVAADSDAGQGGADVQQYIDRIAAAITEYTSTQAANTATGPQLPFAAGAIGVLSYAAGEQLLGIHKSVPDRRWPAVHAGIYQWALVQDHLLKQCHLIADEKLPYRHWQDLLALFRAVNSNGGSCNTIELLEDWRCSLDRPAYADRFERLQEYIRAGDCYQANLTREFSSRYRGDAWAAYPGLRTRAQAPFSAFLRRPEADLLSASPERFIRVENGVATSQPIKGSRPRGASASEDAARIAELVASSKDRAENLMIVDLIRNDFGRCCVTGSVSVPELFAVQSFSNVHHLVSTVRGELPGSDPGNALALLAACMPGGSITGAPKKRAMEIIAELEPHQRSAYCGAVFYLDRSGRLDSNIIIRSLLFERGRYSDSEGGSNAVYCWSGGGIVADSVCEEEYAESDYKVRHLMDALSG